MRGQHGSERVDQLVTVEIMKYIYPAIPEVSKKKVLVEGGALNGLETKQ